MHSGLPTLLISRDALRSGSVRVEGELALGPGWGPDGFEAVAPPRVELTADESPGDRVHAVGRIRARVAEVCTRCLNSAERDVEVALDLRFEPDLDVWEEGPGLYRLDGNREALDVGPALREELILALPDFPVCRPGCKGLCPVCGVDLNETECDCAVETRDSRWDALREQLADAVADDDETEDV